MMDRPKLRAYPSPNNNRFSGLINVIERGRSITISVTNSNIWSPETREKLLQTLDEAGFAEEKLLLLKNMLKMQKCDLLDVLEYIAYDSTPIERTKRVELVKKRYVDSLNKEQREFDDLILQYYVNNGFRELGSDNLKTFITIKFNSMSDAKERLQMSVPDIRAHYFELQRRLYAA